MPIGRYSVQSSYQTRPISDKPLCLARPTPCLLETCLNSRGARGARQKPGIWLILEIDFIKYYFRACMRDWLTETSIQCASSRHRLCVSSGSVEISEWMSTPELCSVHVLLRDSVYRLPLAENHSWFPLTPAGGFQVCHFCNYRKLIFGCEIHNSHHLCHIVSVGNLTLSVQ